MAERKLGMGSPKTKERGIVIPERLSRLATNLGQCSTREAIVGPRLVELNELVAAFVSLNAIHTNLHHELNSFFRDIANNHGLVTIQIPNGQTAFVENCDVNKRHLSYEESVRILKGGDMISGGIVFEEESGVYDHEICLHTDPNNPHRSGGCVELTVSPDGKPNFEIIKIEYPQDSGKGSATFEVPICGAYGWE
jgi:hypothetical protein